MKSKLCNYSFQLKIMKAIRYDNCGRDLRLGHNTISVHTQRTEHILGLEFDVLFLFVHPLVMDMAKLIIEFFFYINSVTCL